ncbi:MAG: aldo/keto reductase [Hyphomicrobiaceae bacterium]
MDQIIVEAHGAKIPAIGFGTWPMKGDQCTSAVATALQSGYRHIDTAAFYGNETDVGAGLKASGRQRDSYFLTTKVWKDDIAPGQLERSAEASLKRLGVSAVDLLLIHWPNPDVATADCIKALCNAKRLGLARHVGVSNFTTRHLADALKAATEPLVCNQVEYHPHLDQAKLLAATRAAGMAFVSYCPLGRGDTGGVMDEPVIKDIATRLGKTSAQIVLRWHVQQLGVVAIPKSATPSRIASNLDIVSFSLAAPDMAAISALARPNGRVVNVAHAPTWD